MLALAVLFSFNFTEAFSQDNQAAVPKFNSQGEQEDYWVKQLFQKEYKEQKFNSFTGKITTLNNIFIFNNDSLTVYGSPTIKAAFSKGLLYPALIGGNHITDIEEIKFAEESPQKRRFRFLLYKKGMFNPTVCVFELKNTKAKIKTDLEKFIHNATLSFFKEGWIMI